jgi:hypothetical protein
VKNWSIDRLALSVPGYPESQARELARLIADALVDLTTVPAWLSAAATDQDQPQLAVEVTAQDGESMVQLAQRIVAALSKTG